MAAGGCACVCLSERVSVVYEREDWMPRSHAVVLLTLFCSFEQKHINVIQKIRDGLHV